MITTGGGGGPSSFSASESAVSNFGDDSELGVKYFSSVLELFFSFLDDFASSEEEEAFSRRDRIWREREEVLAGLLLTEVIAVVGMFG